MFFSGVFGITGTSLRGYTEHRQAWGSSPNRANDSSVLSPRPVHHTGSACPSGAPALVVRYERAAGALCPYSRSACERVTAGGKSLLIVLTPLADSKLVGPPLRELSASAHGLRALTEAGEVLAVDGGAPQAAPDVTDKSDYLLPRLATLEEASP